MMPAEDRYDSLIRYYADKHEVSPWQLLKAQIKAESAFNPMARSSAGAMGLTQFMAPTFNEWVSRLNIVNPNPYNPEHSIHCQAAYMRWLLDQFAGNLDRAIGAYNFGVGNEHRQKPWPDETINYLARIKVYLAEYLPSV
jgi:soluble lytic murein transglycosylase-like protein